MKSIVLFQGIYYFLSAVWPLLSLRTFEMVTGNKKDHWLVYTVALLVLSSSLVFLYSALLSSSITDEVILLSIANSTFLGFVSIYFPLKGVIRKIYLADGLLELLILAGVIYVEFRN